MTGNAKQNYLDLLAGYQSKHGVLPSRAEMREMKAEAMFLAFEAAPSEIIDKPRQRISLKVKLPVS